jgi:hypothetical protein
LPLYVREMGKCEMVEKSVVRLALICEGDGVWSNYWQAIRSYALCEGDGAMSPLVWRN